MSHTDDKHTALLSHSANDTQEPLPAKHHSLDYFNSSSNWAVYCNSCSQLAGFSQLYTLGLWNNIHVLSGTLKPYALSHSVRSQWIIIIIISGKQARKHQRWNVWKQNWFGFNVVSRFTPCVSATTWPYLLVYLLKLFHSTKNQQTSLKDFIWEQILDFYSIFKHFSATAATASLYYTIYERPLR